MMLWAAAILLAAPVPDGRCTFAATNAADRAAITDSVMAGAALNDIPEVTARVEAQVRRCGQGGWSEAELAEEGGGAVDLIVAAVAVERLAALEIPTAPIDAWFAGLRRAAYPRHRLDDAERGRLLDRVAAAGVPRERVDTHQVLIEVYAISLVVAAERPRGRQRR